MLWAAGTAGLALTAEAGGVLTPYAAEDIEHNTNVFDLPKSGGAPVGKNGPTFADTFFDTRAGVEGTYLLDEQKRRTIIALTNFKVRRANSIGTSNGD